MTRPIDREPTRYEIAIEALRDLAENPAETPERRERARKALEADREHTAQSIPIAAPALGRITHRRGYGGFLRVHGAEQGWWD